MEQLEAFEARVMQFLEKESAERGVRTPSGTLVQLDLSKQDIGTLLGMTRAEATRVLNRLKRRGIIQMEGSSIILRS